MSRFSMDPRFSGDPDMLRRLMQSQQAVRTTGPGTYQSPMSLMRDTKSRGQAQTQAQIPSPTTGATPLQPQAVKDTVPAGDFGRRVFSNDVRRGQKDAARQERLTAMQGVDTRGKSASQARNSRLRASRQADRAAGRKSTTQYRNGGVNTPSRAEFPKSPQQRANADSRMNAYREKEMAGKFERSPGRLGEEVRAFQSKGLSNQAISRYLWEKQGR